MAFLTRLSFSAYDALLSIQTQMQETEDLESLCLLALSVAQIGQSMRSVHPTSEAYFLDEIYCLRDKYRYLNAICKKEALSTLEEMRPNILATYTY